MSLQRENSIKISLNHAVQYSLRWRIECKIMLLGRLAFMRRESESRSHFASER